MLLGAPTDIFGDVLVMELEPAPRDARRSSGRRSRRIRSRRRRPGNVGGGAAPDIVVLSQDTLHIYVDGLPTMDKAYAGGRRRSLSARVPSGLPETTVIAR